MYYFIKWSTKTSLLNQPVNLSNIILYINISTQSTVTHIYPAKENCVLKISIVSLIYKQCRIIQEEEIVILFELDELTEDGWSLHDEIKHDFIVHNYLRVVKWSSNCGEKHVPRQK